MKLKRFSALRLFSCLPLFVWPLLNVSAPAAERKPNILIILADDLGYGELSCQGNPQVPTPNIDSLAKTGVRFTSGYVSGPYCSPTRAALMTGRYQQRFGHEFNPGPAEAASEKFGLSLKEKTIGDRFKELGYATGWFGKSHLGYKPEFHPLKRGFDEYFGFLGGAHDYLDAAADGHNPILRGTAPVSEIDYTTDAFGREAVAFIEKHRAEPWLCYLPFNAVHAPLESTQKYLSRFEQIEDKKRRTFAAMLSGMDDAVGAVLAKLRERHLEEDTLIFFFSDNGGPTPMTTSGNGPLRGLKAQTWEGGIRAPWLVRWKAHRSGHADFLLQRQRRPDADDDFRQRPVARVQSADLGRRHPRAVDCAMERATPGRQSGRPAHHPARRSAHRAGGCRCNTQTGLEAGWCQPAALSHREIQPAASGTLLAFWPADRAAHGRLEAGESPRRRCHPARRTAGQSQHRRRATLQPQGGHRRKGEPGRKVPGQGKRTGGRLGERKQRTGRADVGPAGGQR